MPVEHIEWFLVFGVLLILASLVRDRPLVAKQRGRVRRTPRVPPHNHRVTCSTLPPHEPYQLLPHARRACGFFHTILIAELAEFFHTV